MSDCMYQARATRCAEDWSFSVNGIFWIILDIVDIFDKILDLPLVQSQLLLVFSGLSMSKTYPRPSEA